MTQIKDKALLVIEALASDDFVTGLELRPPEDKAARTLMLKLNRIYAYAHVAHNPRCIEVHQDWVKSLKKDYKRLHEAGVF